MQRIVSRTKTKLTLALGILCLSLGTAALIIIPSLSSPEELNPREVYNELSAACADDTCIEKIQECFGSECGDKMVDCLFYWTKDQCGFLPESDYLACELTVFGACTKQVIGSALIFAEPAKPIIPKNPQLTDLLHNEKIIQAIGTLTKSEQDFLYASFNQLETGNTESWKEFDEPKYLSQEETRKIWLRRVAFALYLEVYKKVPWSLLSYSQENVDWLLSYCIKDGTGPFTFMPHTCGQFFRTTYMSDKYIIGYAQPVWSANPIEEFEIGKALTEAKAKVKNIPDDIVNIETTGNAIEKMIYGMRKMGWSHIFDGWDGSKLATPILSVYQNAVGTCNVNTYFLAHVLRSWNIPAEPTTMVSGMTHAGIYFPTEEKGFFHTDNIQQIYFEKLPVSAAYQSIDILSAGYNKPTCEGLAFEGKISFQKVLAYYTDPLYRFHIYHSIPYSNTSVCSGKFWQEFPTSTGYAFCNKNSPVFSQQEVDVWKQTLTAYDEKENICGKVTGLILPLPPVSTISVTVNDPIKTVEASLECNDKGNSNIPLPPGPTPHTFIIDKKDIVEKYGAAYSCNKANINLSYYDQNGDFIGTKKEGEFSFTLP